LRKKKTAEPSAKKKASSPQKKKCASKNPNASSKDNPDAVESHGKKMLELLGYAEKFIHVMFHL